MIDDLMRVTALQIHRACHVCACKSVFGSRPQGKDSVDLRRTQIKRGCGMGSPRHASVRHRRGGILEAATVALDASFDFGAAKPHLPLGGEPFADINAIVDLCVLEVEGSPCSIIGSVQKSAFSAIQGSAYPGP